MSCVYEGLLNRELVLFLMLTRHKIQKENKEKKNRRGGGVSSSSLSFKETCTETGRCEERQGKRVLFYMAIEEF